jgi:alpha-L-rhamnosidase
MKKIGRLALAAVVMAVAGLSASFAAAEGRWVTLANLAPKTQVVLHFRKEIGLAQVPDRYRINISADNRFILYVNGVRVGAGPSRGDLAHWRYEGLDLAPYLRKGRNVIAAEVWNAVEESSRSKPQTAPLAQLSARVAFWVEGEGEASKLDTGEGWLASIQPGHGFRSPFLSLAQKLGPIFYAAGSSEDIDGAKADWDWNGPRLTGANWMPVVPAIAEGETPPWTLVASQLPQMAYKLIPVGKVVRTNLSKAKVLGRGGITVPANSKVSILVDQAQVISAYPEVKTSRGKGATITVTYAEALYDANKKKGDRSEIANRTIIGVEDTFRVSGGAHRSYRPLWWRTFRYVQLDVMTGAEPLSIDGLQLFETGYPFAEKGYFRSNDPQLDKIWKIGWQTVRVDAHETFQDSSYWEQLQYVGDTRLQSLIAYTVSGDPRLPVQAIDAFADSQEADGMIESAYPSSTDNSIPPFGLLWIGMMHDYLRNQPDTAVLRRNVESGRKVLAWFEPYVVSNGLLTMNPGWNFVDWAGEAQMPYSPSEYDRFPSYDRATKTSCLTSLTYLGALKDMAAIEAAVGDPQFAGRYSEKAVKLTADIRNQCWDAKKGLFADSPAKTVFSQHANAMAVLYDVAPPDQMGAILSRVTMPKGTEAPDGIIQSSYYFSWYLIQAFDHAGLSDTYLDRLQTWRDLTRLNFTTWPESRGDTRSDTHAWSSHPTADLIGIVAGIRSAAPGYARVVVAPHLGHLTELDAAAATPAGLVSVSYRRLGNGGLSARITKPANLPGEFVWNGKAYPLSDQETVLTLP